MLFFLLSCSGEPEDCLGTPGGEAQTDDCGVCDSNEENDCILTDLEGVWIGHTVCDNPGEMTYQFTFAVDSFDVLGTNDPWVSGGTDFGLSYSGGFLINETAFDYNEIDIQIIDSSIQSYIGQAQLGIYTILEDSEANILRIAIHYSPIIRPEEIALDGNCEHIEDNGIRLFRLTRQ